MRLCVDIDGTITNALHRAHLIPDAVSNTRHWTGYNKASVRDTPRKSVIDIVRACYVHNNDEVILLTSRGEAADFETMSWLRKHRVPYERLIMRSMKDQRSSLEYKREWLTQLHPDLLIDDCPQICRMASVELGLNVMLINSLDPFVVMAGGVK